MKLDWDLLRSVLRMAEQCEGGCPLVCTATVYTAPHYKLNWRDTKYGFGTVCEHMLLLGDAGLAVVRDLGMGGDGPVGAVLERVTMRGHEFLAVSRHEGTWSDAKRLAETIGFGVQPLVDVLGARAELELERLAPFAPERRAAHKLEAR
jgi:hypothetical protein